MSIVYVKAFIKVLLRDDTIGDRHDLPSFPVVFEGLADSVRKPATSIHITEENVRLKLSISCI